MPLRLANACGDGGIDVSPFFLFGCFRKGMSVVSTEPETRQDTSQVSAQWPEWARNGVITKGQHSTKWHQSPGCLQGLQGFTVPSLHSMQPLPEHHAACLARQDSA